MDTVALGTTKQNQNLLLYFHCF